MVYSLVLDLSLILQIFAMRGDQQQGNGLVLKPFNAKLGSKTK